MQTDLGNTSEARLLYTLTSVSALTPIPLFLLLLFQKDSHHHNRHINICTSTFLQILVRAYYGDPQKEIHDVGDSQMNDGGTKSCRFPDSSAITL